MTAPQERPDAAIGREATQLWRTGRSVGRTIYAQVGAEPSDADVLIGVMDSPDLAAEAVRAYNALRAQERPVAGDGLDREAIKRRAEAATPGPWKWNSYDDGYESVRNELEGVLDPSGGESRYRAISVSDADAAFIAHARTDVPALLAALEAAEAAYADLSAAVVGPPGGTCTRDEAMSNAEWLRRHWRNAIDQWGWWKDRARAAEAEVERLREASVPRSGLVQVGYANAEALDLLSSGGQSVTIWREERTLPPYPPHTNRPIPVNEPVYVLRTEGGAS